VFGDQHVVGLQPSRGTRRTIVTPRGSRARARRRHRIVVRASRSPGSLAGIVVAIAIAAVAVACEPSLSEAVEPPAEVPRAPDVVRQEIFRIDQDLHPDEDYEIVLDGWVRGGEELVDVRMTWVDTAEADRRSPFGRGVRRHLDLQYVRHDARSWTVHMRSRIGHRAFAIELDAAGIPVAFADIRTSAGAIVERCRVHDAQLAARRILGVPYDLSGLAVTCTDAAGNRRDGEPVGE
jgi:hypothetical protein